MHAEILERRYPVVLREFSLRPGSGGPGRHRGGDGVIREVEIPLTKSVPGFELTFHLQRADVQLAPGLSKLTCTA